MVAKRKTVSKLVSIMRTASSSKGATKVAKATMSKASNATIKGGKTTKVAKATMSKASKATIKGGKVTKVAKATVPKASKETSKGGNITKEAEELVDPSSVGLDPSKIQGYEDTMEKLVKVGEVPGCASMVWRHGKLVQCRGWGHIDIQKSAPFDVNTLCRTICATKCLFSVCVMTLIEDGKLCLDDPVHKYIPAFKDIKVVNEQDETKPLELTEPILVKHCLCHMTGIDYCIEPTEKATSFQAKKLIALQQAAHRGELRNLEEFVDRLATIPLSCQPGKKYTYSYSYDVLVRIIEIVCGKSADKCLEERVLQPLGMTSTFWGVPESECHRLTALYAGPKNYKALYAPSSMHCLLKGPGRKPYDKMVQKGKMIEIERGGKDSMFVKGRECPIIAGGGYMGYDAGGLVSCVADFAKFAKMIFSYGLMENGERLVQEATVKSFEENQLDMKSQGKAWDYQANGVCYLGNIGTFRDGAGEVGMGGAANTYWNIDREDGTASVWFAQHLDLPDFGDLKTVDPKKASLWDLLHSAKLPEAGAETGSKKRKAAK